MNLDFIGRRHATTVIVLLLAAGLCGLPLLTGRFLPLIDVPQHMAMARVVSGLLSGDANFTRYYQLDFWPQPYWLYYILVVGLSKITTVEIANKIVLFAISMGIVLGVRALLLAFGRDPRWCLLAVPLAWTSSFFYAFMAYLVGVPLVLFGLVVLEKSCSAPTPTVKNQIQLLCLSLLIYLSHAQAYLWFLLSVTTLMFLHWRGLRWSARILLPIAPSFATFATWVWRTFSANKPATTGVPGSTYGSLSDMEMRWEDPFSKRFVSFMEQLFGGCTDGSNRWLGWAWFAVVAVGIALSLRARKRSSKTTFRFREGIIENRLELTLAVFLVTWMILPYDLRGQWYLAPRYLPFAAAIAIVVASGTSVVHRWLLWAGILISIGFSLNVARVINGFQSTMLGFADVLEHVPAGERVLHFPFDERNTYGPDRVATNGVASVIDMPTTVAGFGYITEFPGSPASWLSPTHHVSAYHIIWKGGDIGVSFAAAPTNPVRYRPGVKPTSVVEYEYEKVNLEAVTREFNWFLVRGPLQGTTTRLEEFAERVVSSGSWDLWRTRPPKPN